MRVRATVVSLIAVVSCAPTSHSTSAIQTVPQLPKPVVTTPEVEPARGTNEIAIDSWTMPPLPHRAPSFPYLKGEDQSVSRSIGDVSFGHLVSAHAMQYPHPRISMLRVHAGRDLIYTSDQMATLIEAAAKTVAERHPGAVTYVGNFSALGGGDIPYSVSHNNGRDADLAFFMTDEDGDPVEPPDLLPLEDDGTYASDNGDVYQFDTARNWTLIEALLEQSDRLQLIFVSDPLREQLLSYAEEQKVDKKIVARARALLMQPRGTLPHNDHFHIRLRCTPSDAASGCVSAATPGSADAKRNALAAAREALLDVDATVRAAAIRRLVLLRDRQSAKRIAALLADESPIVRAAAARALGTLKRETRSLAKRLKVEEQGVVTAEIIWALADIKSRTSRNALRDFLKEPHQRNFNAIDPIDVRVFAADALVDFESKDVVPALIKLVHSDDGELSDRAHRALTYLTNRDVTVARKDPKPKKRAKKRKTKKSRKKPNPSAASEPPTRAELWDMWWKKNRRKSRSAWLVDGFRAAGFDVTKVDKKNVWDLSRAISGPDHVSYNAQRAMMKMTGRRVNSLAWSKADASFNWRRWFERRMKRLRLPKIPPELSTLNPVKK